MVHCENGNEACVVLLLFFFSGCKNDNVLLKKLNIFSFCVQSIDSGKAIELPQRGCFNEYPQSMLDQH